MKNALRPSENLNQSVTPSTASSAEFDAGFDKLYSDYINRVRDRFSSSPLFTEFEWPLPATINNGQAI